MLTSFAVKNYKSLGDVCLSFSGLDILVGNNASGKSTMLRAMDFLMRSASEDFITISGQRDLLVSDIICKWKKSNQMHFISEYFLTVGDQDCHLHWKLMNEYENRRKVMGQVVPFLI